MKEKREKQSYSIKILAELEKNPSILPLIFWDGIHTTQICPGNYKDIEKIEEEEECYFEALCSTFVSKLLDIQYVDISTNEKIKLLHQKCTYNVEGLNKDTTSDFTHQGGQHYDLLVTQKDLPSHIQYRNTIKQYLKEYHKNNYNEANYDWLVQEHKSSEFKGVYIMEKLYKSTMKYYYSNPFYKEINLEDYMHICHVNLFSKEENEYIASRIISDYAKELPNCNGSDEKIYSIAKMVQMLERLHPFKDANGRTFSMMLLNLELVKNKLPPTLQDNPNFVDLMSLESLVERIKEGQKRYSSVVENTKEISNLEYKTYDGKKANIDPEWLKQAQDVLKPKHYVKSLRSYVKPSSFFNKEALHKKTQEKFSEKIKNPTHK